MQSKLLKTFVVLIVTVAILYASGVAPAAYSLIMDEAGALARRSTVNFAGAGVTCVDNAGALRTDCTIPGGTAAAGNYAKPFNSVSSLTITNAEHGFGHANLLVACYDNSSPPKYFQPSQVTINAATYQVDITFSGSSTGYCVVNGSSGSGGGATIATGTYAALPGTCTAGNAYLPTDSFYDILRCGAGNAWAHFLNGKQLTPPINGDYADLNGPTVVTTNGGIAITAAATGNDQIRGRIKASPGGSFTVEVAFIPLVLEKNFHGAGIVARQSSDGKLWTLAFTGDASTYSQIGSADWDSPTAYNAGNFAFTVAPSTVVYLRYREDATTRYASWSRDGQNFIELFSENKTTFLTADQIGIIVHENDATFGTTASFIHWLQF
jgi:hypothetical protein